MKNQFIIPILLIALFLPAFVGAQSASLQVVAVKGTVKYQSKVLKKDDIITVSNLNALPSTLVYGSGADWVNFLNKKDRKIVNYYASKQKSPDGKYMFSRGDESVEVPAEWQTPGVKQLKGDNEVLAYFRRDAIFLFGNDTLVCTNMKVYETRSGSGFMLEYYVDSVLHEALLGNGDTLYITRQQIFRSTAGQGLQHPNSYDAGSMKLVYFNKESNEKNYLEVDEFSIYFIEDIVLGLREIGMDNKNICAEIMHVFSTPEQLEVVSGSKEQKVIEKWLMKRIKKIR
jgi:hypothetical protein